MAAADDSADKMLDRYLYRLKYRQISPYSDMNNAYITVSAMLAPTPD